MKKRLVVASSIGYNMCSENCLPTIEQANRFAPALGIAAAVVLLLGMYFCLEILPEWMKVFWAWIDKRALIRSARSFGIEYIPGESLEDLRRRVIAKRDEVIK